MELSERKNALTVGANYAKQQNMPHIQAILDKTHKALTQPVTMQNGSSRKKVVIVYFNNNWCDKLIADAMAVRLKKKCDVVAIPLQDRGSIPIDADLYLASNIRPMLSVPNPEQIAAKTVFIIASERVLKDSTFFNVDVYPKLLGVIPLNKFLETTVKQLKPKHVYKAIPNGIDTTMFFPAHKFPKEFTVGASGNFSNEYFDDWKGFNKYIVPACKRANVKLHWCGWLGRSKNPAVTSVQLPLEKMPDYYRSLSCLVTMSKSEACSSVTFEAMASGLPVISTKTGWHGENCTEQDILWINRPTDETPENIALCISDLTNKLIQLKKNKKLCTQLGKNARVFAEKYSWDKIFSQWEEAINFYLQMAKVDAIKLAGEKAKVAAEKAAVDKLKADQVRVAADKLKVEPVKPAIVVAKSEVPKKSRQIVININLPKGTDVDEVINVNVN